jgi:CheY-like chemotaxis protein
MLNGGLGIESVDDAAEAAARDYDALICQRPQFRRVNDKNLTSIRCAQGSKFQVVWKQFALLELSYTTEGKEMGVDKILFVEDDFIVSHDLCEFLRDAGYAVKPVYCGKAAFEVIDRHEHLIALLTDINLGPGPDGVDVARYARAFSPELPVVFVSSAADPRHEGNGVARSEFVAKPFLPEQVADALGRVIRLEAA